MSARAPRRERSSSDVAAALRAVRQRYGIDLSDARVRAGFGRGHALELLLHARAVQSAVDTAALPAARALLRSSLGPETFDTWVGDVKVAPLRQRSRLKLLDDASGTPELLDLGELRPCIEAVIAEVRAGLPERPYWRCAADLPWTMLEVEPVPSEDPPEQDDLFLATTALPEMLKAFLRGDAVPSARFSNHDETFCYLKWRDGAADAGERMQRRVAVEDALDAALVRARLGCVVGSGLGLQYTYVHLALTDTSAASGAIEDVCHRLSMGPGWLLFFDAGARDRCRPLCGAGDPPG